MRCHTYPNDKLLQPDQLEFTRDKLGSCHTYPNDKLLQHDERKTTVERIELSYLSKR